jgi:hypothetical protein
MEKGFKTLRAVVEEEKMERDRGERMCCVGRRE